MRQPFLPGLQWPTFQKILEATGYIENSALAPGVSIGSGARAGSSRRIFAPDASWKSQSSLTVYFKFEDSPPHSETVATWRKEIWNESFAPLLWILCPEKIYLYDTFARPVKDRDADENLIKTFKTVDRELRDLDAFAGRISMETGEFWTKSSVNRKTCVDQQLLLDLGRLENDLVGGLGRKQAQELIGRSIFTQFLIDRGILDARRLQREFGATTLADILRNPMAARGLFKWLATAFNGDMFPKGSALTFGPEPLSRVSDFLQGIDQTGQYSLFPYQFDIIPVELISSIYEQFVHAKTTGVNGNGLTQPSEGRQRAVHYTRLPVVSLVLDEVLAETEITGNETVLDLTCGSGVFLVESFRRLVRRKSRGTAPSRRIIRSTLYRQIFGVDLSEAAIRVAAFSLYLAALEMDPDPQPPEALKFKPLIGRNLIEGDAMNIESNVAGAPLRRPGGGRRLFDVIVGNPPWTFRGKSGTAERRIRKHPDQPLQPRGESLDFLLRAIEFGHRQTRYGIVLSALPFFAGSKTGASAMLNALQQLPPVTIVNLAAHRDWLFPTAKAPAFVLLAGCRPQQPGLLTLVNVPWSPAAERSYTFQISPSNIVNLPLTRWDNLKAAAFGRARDIFLLDSLRTKHRPLSVWLGTVGTKSHVGLILGSEKQRTRSASNLRGLEVLGTDDLRPFRVPAAGLPTFKSSHAQWPRSREIYRSPLLLIKEFVLDAEPRPIAAICDRDLVYTNSYFGVPLGEHRDCGRLLAAILGSALASWFFLMTAAEFGIWKRRLLKTDVDLLPVPDLIAAAKTRTGRNVLAIEQDLRSRESADGALARLDQAVFDLYDLDGAERVVVSDGLIRAGWQWEGGRELSAEPAGISAELRPYAETVLSGIESWLKAMGKRRLRAEVFDLRGYPLRIVRFVLERHPGPSVVEVLKPRGDLADLLTQIGERLKVRLSSALIGERTLRIHGPNEVLIIKPAARRFWMQSAALEDADAIVAESLGGMRI
jgi:hypothetical protein